MTERLEGFTRGPLTVGQRSATTYTVQAEINGQRVTIAAFYGAPGEIRPGERAHGDASVAKANAELFAKAPDMYALLVRARGLVETCDAVAVAEELIADIDACLASEPRASILERLRRDAPLPPPLLYVIGHIDHPDVYYGIGGWIPDRDRALKYGEQDRRDGRVHLPAHGCWVRVEG